MPKMRRSIFMSFALIAVISLVLNGIVYLANAPILTFLRVPGELRPMMQEYLLVIYAGIFATFLYNYYASLLRAIGNSVTPLIFLAVSAVLNVGLDLFFVAGVHWGIPSMFPVSESGCMPCGIFRSFCLAGRTESGKKRSWEWC